MAIRFLSQESKDTFKGKKVICRFDFNVPLEEKEGEIIISDNSRVEMSLPTIKFLIDSGAKKIILMSHLGRPKGEKNPKLSLEPVAKYLAEVLGEEVILTESATDGGIKTLLGLSKNRLILLENIRFHKEEEKNDAEFAKTLSEYADFYVNDAFGAAHRAHASTHAINAFFRNKAFAGMLIEKELKALEKITKQPEKPMMAIIGGAKVSDKITTINKLLPLVSKMFIGGAMAYPFLKAKEHTVGKSLCSDEDVKLAKTVIKNDKAEKLQLPIDHLASQEFGGAAINVETIDIPSELMGLDIGPKTTELYASLLKEAKTVFWNGPMGLFENPEYAEGTNLIAQALSEVDGFTLVGGGDSVSAVVKSGLSEKMGHVSSGGGASLEFIEKGRLPGIDALKYGVDLS